MPDRNPDTTRPFAHTHATNAKEYQRERPRSCVQGHISQSLITLGRKSSLESCLVAGMTSVMP